MKIAIWNTERLRHKVGFVRWKEKTISNCTGKLRTGEDVADIKNFIKQRDEQHDEKIRWAFQSEKIIFPWCKNVEISRKCISMAQVQSGICRLVRWKWQRGGRPSCFPYWRRHSPKAIENISQRELTLYGMNFHCASAMTCNLF